MVVSVSWYFISTIFHMIPYYLYSFLLHTGRLTNNWFNKFVIECLQRIFRFSSQCMFYHHNNWSKTLTYIIHPLFMNNYLPPKCYFLRWCQGSVTWHFRNILESFLTFFIQHSFACFVLELSSVTSFHKWGWSWIQYLMVCWWYWCIFRNKKLNSTLL